MNDEGVPRVVSVATFARGRRQRFLLDDGRTFEVGTDVWLAARVGVGIELDDAALMRILDADAREVAHEAALRLLSYRARSEKEIRDRLSQRGIAPAVADAEVVRLREAGLLDDESFARIYVADRGRLAPRGARLLQQELRTRGVAAEVAMETTAGQDDLAVAMDLARSRCRGEAATRYDLFRSRVGGFLQRRGFSYDVVTAALRTTWLELGQPDADTDRGTDGFDDEAPGLSDGP